MSDRGPPGAAGIDAARVEEAGLNALQTQRQLFYDGWLLRVSPGKAKRARSVNAHFGSTLPLAVKIAQCERLYVRHALPDGVALTEPDVMTFVDIVGDLRGSPAPQPAAHTAYLQVEADNAPAIALYRKFGFVTLYTYHYRGRPGECR